MPIDRYCHARGDGAAVLPARRVGPGRALPGALAARRRAGTSRSPAGRSGQPGDPSHAETFFAGRGRARARLLGVAATRPTRWPPIRPSTPPSRTGRARPTGSSRASGDADYERLVAMLGASAARRRARREADLLHLHHLTPINEAAERAFPDVPRIGHLHGTELLMLREIDEGPPAGLGARRRVGRADAALGARLRAAARALAGRGAAGAGPARGGRPSGWSGRPTGSTPQGFDRRPAGRDARLAHWRRWLVEEPRGWDESGEPGSVAYRDEHLEPFARAGACCSTWAATPRSSASRS